ncbi:MAG: ABC transporter permease [Edaphobacter sp.]
MSLFRRISNLFWRSRMDREIDAEIKSHLQMRTEDNIASGMPPDQARRDALIRFGNPTVTKERVTASDAALTLESIGMDVRYAFRRLAKSPGFSITAILTLALGIGATTAIFSAAYALLLRSLPFQHADRIIGIYETHPQVVGPAEVNFLDYQDWRAQQKSFEQVAAYSGTSSDTMSLVMEDHGEQVHTVLASSNLFSLLGVVPILGRTFVEQDDTPNGNHVVVLSAEAWQHYFSGDRSVLGRNIDLNGINYTVIGVLPPGDAYPATGEFWMPLSLMDKDMQTRRVGHTLDVLGRLKPGVEVAQARTDMQTIAARLAQVYPATNRNIGVLLVPLREQLVGSLRPAVLTLLSCVVLVLCIACANVANLLLVRAATHVREVAVRQALGASRLRMFTLYLSETLILCLLAGLLGTILAALTLPLLRVAFTHTAGADPSLVGSIQLNVPVLLVTLGVCLFTAILFGLLPMIKTPSKLAESLRPGDRSSTGRQSWSRSALISTEIAIAIVVLFLGTLLIRSFQELISVDPGFRTDHLLSLEITLPQPRYEDSTPATNHFYERLIDKLQQSPGILSAGATDAVPLQASHAMTRFLIAGAAPVAPGALPMEQVRSVSPDFFHTMGLELKQGRAFEQKDIENSSHFIIVNQAFAQRYFSGKDPLTSSVLMNVLSPHPEKMPVIGVVSNAHDLGVETEAEPELYFPGFGVHAVLLIRTNTDSKSILPEVRSAVRDLDPNQPIYHVETIDEVLSDSLARQKMIAVLLGIFALLALTLAAIGIYGVITYSVTQRQREIGVRMALGATRAKILLLILRQAATFTGIGVLVGLVAAFASAHLASALLFQTSTVDPISICVSIFGLMVIAMLAAVLPAGRAATINPIEALRSE